jgi:hypothetical protein
MFRAVLCLALVCACAPAFAQPREPLPPLALDARGAFVLLPRDPVTAQTLGVTAADLATHSLGMVFGVHAYPWRGASVAFGVGAELFLARGKKQNFDEEDVPEGPEVRRQIQSFSGQISLNFGHREGWSYLTAGIGPLAFDTYLTGTLPDGPRVMTQNYGFGARWFTKPHVAFTVDMRFYLVGPSNPTDIVGGRERHSVTVMSAGISVK